LSCSLFFSGINRLVDLEVQTAFAGCFGEGLDAAVIDEGAAVEDDFLDAGLDRALGNQLADCGRSCSIGTGLEVAAKTGVKRRCRCKRAACASSMTCA
jgi:hypothetical protein